MDRRQSSQAERIARALGGAKKYPSGWWCRCPVHQTENSDRPSLKLMDGEIRLLASCAAQCDLVDIFRELRRRGLLDDGVPQHEAPPPKLRDPDDAARTKYALSLWRDAQPIPGTLGEVYLTKRGLLLPLDAEMRFLARCPREQWRQPAVILLLRDIRTNEPRAIQRRFLKDDGSKDGEAWSLGSSAGTVWKLSPDEDVTHGLGIAEGHADALAVFNDGWMPIWATGGTQAMAGFPVLGGIESLTIFADNDGPGRTAAETCAQRWRARGREVGIVRPPAKDFAELVRTT
jgi:phage/plasmid primase-like uncharacterized protein